MSDKEIDAMIAELFNKDTKFDRVSIYRSSVEVNDDRMTAYDVIRRIVKHVNQDAIKLIVDYGWIDGAHHKQWVLDQVLRQLAGDEYAAIVPTDWDTGVAP